MSRVLAAAILLLGLLPCAYAQRGGMRGSGGGGMRGFGGGHPAMGFRAAPGGFGRTAPQSFASRPFASHPMRFGPAARSFGFAGMPRSSFVHPRATVIRSFTGRQGAFSFGRRNGQRSFHTRDFDDRFHHHPFRHPFLYAFPYYYSGAYFDPYYDQYFNPYYSFGSYSYDPNAGTSSYTDLSNEMGNLDAQLQELRDENDSLRSELDQSPRPSSPLPAVSTSSSSEPATVLVFNDGHRTEVQNYAVVGQTLWILSDARATKVPLSDLNLNQTIKTNEERGVEFLGPSSRQ
jgi:hypothetical protein